jgi:cytochrome c oxidase subunit 2
MKKIMNTLTSLAAFAGATLTAAAAFAQSGLKGAGYESIAAPWQLNFQNPATPVMERIVQMHDFLLILITAITVFVLLVMIYICVRFRRKANPVASNTTHNTLLEVIWTTIPIIILVIIAIPSLRLHYYMQHPENPEMTLKVVGYQWYWHYEYPDQGGFGFDSYIRKGNDLKEGDHRLLAVDNRVVVPVDTTVRVLVTGADVIHSWAMPAFGVKRDGVPGRLNETWFKATKIGTFYGQCSELCGVGHGFMPIVVEVVSKDDFNAWAAQKKQESGGTDAKKSDTPLAKPESATAKSPEPKITEEKKNSQEKGEGKPAQ